MHVVQFFGDLTPVPSVRQIAMIGEDVTMLSCRMDAPFYLFLEHFVLLNRAVHFSNI